MGTGVGPALAQGSGVAGGGLALGGCGIAPPDQDYDQQPDDFAYPGTVIARWDASDEASITESAGAVSTWADQTATGADLTASGSARPTTGASTQNGLNVLDFDGSNNVLAEVMTAATWKQFHDGTRLIDVFAVVKIADSADPGVVYRILGTAISSSQIGFGLFWDDRGGGFPDEGIRGTVVYGTGGQNAVGLIGADNSAPPQQFGIVHMQLDPDAATAADRGSLSFDGIDSGAVNTSTNSPSTSDPTNDFQVGAIDDSEHMPGKVAEIVLCASASAHLTDTQVAQYRSYLANKWGITAGSLTGVYRLNSNAGYSYYPVVVREPTTGTVIVAYGGDGTGHDYYTERRLVAVEGHPESGWGGETTIASTGDDDATFGMGLDSDNRALCWHRRRKASDDTTTPSDYELWRRTSAGSWTQVTTITAPTYEMIEIHDIVRLESGRLMSWWHNETWEYGILYSDDNGASWTQVRFATGLADDECPVEVYMVELANGDLIALARNQGSPGTDPLWQLTCDAADDPTVPGNWTVAASNISDAEYSTASIVNVADTLHIYYAHRSNRDILYRTVDASDVYASPTSWPAATTLKNGANAGSHEDMGGVNAIRFTTTDVLVIFYTDDTAGATTDIQSFVHDISV